MQPTHGYTTVTFPPVYIARTEVDLTFSWFFGNADSKALKTLALCWAYRKRAFSVSGLFRRLLSDLIKHLHNSNRQLRQITFSGEIIQEEKFHVIGFVPADVVRLNKDIWFEKLDSDQVSSVEEFLTTCMHGPRLSIEPPNQILNW